MRRWPESKRTEHGFHLFGVMCAPYANVPCSSTPGGLFVNGALQTGKRLPWNPEPLCGLDYQLFSVALDYGLDTTLAKEIEGLNRTLLGSANPVSLRELYDKVKVSAGLEGVNSRFAYLDRIHSLVTNGEPVDERHIVLNLFLAVQWLADIAPRNRVVELQQLTLQIADALAARHQLYRVAPLRHRLGLLLAATMYDEALELITERLSSFKAEERYLGIVVKAKVLLATDGIDRVALFLNEELRKFERDFDKPYPSAHASIVMMCAWAYRTVGKPAEALRVYQRGIDEPLIPPITDHGRQYKISMVFQAARMKERLGKYDEAAALFKRVVDSPESITCGLLDGNTIFNVVPLGRRAIEHLERLRGTRKTLSRIRTDYSTDRLFKLATDKIEAGDLATGIKYLYIVIRRVEGYRWGLGGGLNGDENYLLGLQAKSRLKGLRIEDNRNQ